jgi:hypothetical protein
MPDHNLEIRGTAVETRETATTEGEEAVGTAGTAETELADSPLRQDQELEGITGTIPKSQVLHPPWATQRRQQVDLLGVTITMFSLWKQASSVLEQASRETLYLPHQSVFGQSSQL